MPKFRWTAGLRQHEGYHGIVLRHVSERDYSLVAVWPDDASAADIADALEKLARALRKQDDA